MLRVWGKFFFQIKKGLAIGFLPFCWGGENYIYPRIVVLNTKDALYFMNMFDDKISLLIEISS